MGDFEGTKAQREFLGALCRAGAFSAETAVPLKDKQRIPSGILARKGLIKIQLPRTTIRKVVWLSPTGRELCEPGSSLEKSQHG